MWQCSAIPTLPCRARIHLFAPLPSQNSFTGSCTSRININFLLLNAGAATYEPPLGEICRPEPHVRSCPCVSCVLLAWGKALNTRTAPELHPDIDSLPNFTDITGILNVFDFYWCKDAHGMDDNFAWRRPCRRAGSPRTHASRWSAGVA